MEAHVHLSAPEPDGSVTRWRNFGHDRLYVRMPSGADLGWWDLTTDEGHSLDPQLAPELERIVRNWQSAHGLRAPSRPVLRQVTPLEAEDQQVDEPTADPTAPRRAAGYVEPVRSVVEPPADLLANRAGEALMRQEVAELAAGRSTGRRFADFVPVASSWEVGAVGEQLVADELRKLAAFDPRWGFLNSIPVNAKGTDIDHLVIGPGGVFTINAKHHRDARIWVGGDVLMVNGEKTWYVRNARHEATNATTRLSEAIGRPIRAFGLVVPVGAASLTIKSSPADVAVVNRRRLVSYFTSLPTILDKDTVLAVFEAARNCNTWLGVDG
jgi:hypothetical protein